MSIRSGCSTSTGRECFSILGPDALNWLIEHIDGLIESEGIDLYRQISI